MVRRVLDRWFGAGYRYFKLLDEEGATYILRHDEGRGVWEMTFFERMSPIAAGAMQVAES
jgi:hypothetical protein